MSADVVPATAVQVLGGVRVKRADGSYLEPASASQRRLLALLALHAPRPVRGEWLAEALSLSPGALRTTVSRVRAALGSDVLETAGSSYALSVTVDANIFTRAVSAIPADGPNRLVALQDALERWSGSPVEEFATQEWAEAEVAQLTEIHAGTVEDCADALIAAGRPSDAVARLEVQVAHHPYRDRSRGLLIRALASAGRRVDALRAFQQYRALLVEELGIEPSTEVVRIERRVATGWDGTQTPTDPDAARIARMESGAGSETSPPSHGTTRPFAAPRPPDLPADADFVGRHDELELLTTELARVQRDGFGAVIVSGEAGIGKTTLLAAFAQRVQTSGAAAVLYGRCDRSPVPLQPLRPVLESIVDHASTALLTAHVAHSGGELRRICPRLGTRVTTAPVPTTSDDATEQYLAFEAAADLFGRTAAQRPLVVLLDDIQWVEATGLMLLRRLASSLSGAPVLMIIAMRESGAAPTDDLRLTLAELERGHLTHLSLSGLAPADLLHLVAEPSLTSAGDDGAADVAGRLHQETAGHPLYASQLLRHWRESGRLSGDLDPSRLPAMGIGEIPPSLREVVTLRVRALGADAAQVLGTASVLGMEFCEDTLVEVESLPESTVLDVIDAATRAGLLEPAPSVRRHHRFIHDLVARALSASLGSTRRARLHGRAARALEDDIEHLTTETVVALARHCRRAGWPADAQRWSTVAGDRALTNHAPGEAAVHYRAALDLAVEQERPEAERADLLVRLGDAQHRAGDAAALPTLQAGAQLARHAQAHCTLAQAALATDRGFVQIDRHATEQLGLVRAALEVADPHDRSTLARLLALLAQCLVYTPDAAGRVAATEKALALAEEVGDTTLRAQIGPGVLWGLTEPGKETLRGRIARDTIAAAESTGDPRLVFGAHHAAYNVAIETADHVASTRSLAKIRTMAHTLDEPRLRWVVGLYEAFEAMMAGRLEEAEAITAANWQLGVDIAAPDATTLFSGQLYVIGTFGGRHAELFPLVEQAVRDNPEVLSFRLARAVCCAVVGQTDEARSVLDDGRRQGFGELLADNLWTTSVLGYAVLAIELDDVDAAQQLLPLIEPLAAMVAFNGITSQGPIAAYIGKLASLLGDHDRAQGQLRHALATAEAFGWTYHRATTQFALAQNTARRVGAPDHDARNRLDEALDLCRTHGFRSWIPRIEALRALG